MREQVAVRTAIGCTILGSLLAPARPPQAPLCLDELCWMRESAEGRTAIGCTILWDPLQASLLLDELCRMSQDVEGCTLLLTPLMSGLARAERGVRG